MLHSDFTYATTFCVSVKGGQIMTVNRQQLMFNGLRILPQQQTTEETRFSCKSVDNDFSTGVYGAKEDEAN